MNSWPRKPLAQLCDPDRGITYGIVKVGDFVPGGVPVIRGGDIRNNTIVFSEEKRVSEEVSRQFRRTIIRGGEILINLISEPGHCAIAPVSLQGANVSRDVAVIALSDEVNHQYVNYFLKSPRTIRWFESRLQGSVTQKINLSTLKEVEVPIPPREVQDEIVGTLMALDGRIELDRRMNETLEAMAQAIFQDWFVEFGPTRRKMAGATDPVAIIGGVIPDPARAEALAGVFPEALGDDGIPEGWTERPLDSTATFLNGIALQKYPAEHGKESLPVIKIAELRNGIGNGTGRASRGVPDKYLIQNGDYLFSWSGSLMAKFWTEGEGALNQHLFKVSSSDYPSWFYSAWVQQHMEDFRQIAASKATTMGHIQRGHLSAAKTVGPGLEDLRTLGEVLEPLVARAIHNDLESRTLAAARDLLLPKLLSGEIRLNAA